jgi:hypothetical protein
MARGAVSLEPEPVREDERVDLWNLDHGGYVSTEVLQQGARLGVHDVGLTGSYHDEVRPIRMREDPLAFAEPALEVADPRRSQLPKEPNDEAFAVRPVSGSAELFR